MARIKRWVRVVLKTQLDRLSRCLASNLGNHAQSKVVSGRNAARGDDIAVLDDAGFCSLADNFYSIVSWNFRAALQVDGLAAQGSR